MSRELIPRQRPFAASASEPEPPKVDVVLTPATFGCEPVRRDHAYTFGGNSSAFVVGQTVNYCGVLYIVEDIDDSTVVPRLDLKGLVHGCVIRAVDAVKCYLSTLKVNDSVKYKGGTAHYRVYAVAKEDATMFTYRIADKVKTYNNYKVRRRNLLVEHT